MEINSFKEFSVLKFMKKPLTFTKKCITNTHMYEDLWTFTIQRENLAIALNNVTYHIGFSSGMEVFSKCNENREQCYKVLL